MSTSAMADFGLDLAEVHHVGDQRIIARAPFRFEYPLHRVRVERIRTQSVDLYHRKGDHSARSNECSGFLG